MKKSIKPLRINMSLSKTSTDLGSVFGSFTNEQIELIKKTVCKGATDNELQLFLYTCKHAGLDPLLKQIYAIKRGGTMTIQTSIDGLRLIAERTERYSPGKETVYAYDEKKGLLSATSYVNKMTPDGTWHEVAATAYFAEYAQAFNGRLTNFWLKMPHVMLAKCAEANALRRAFPFELAGLYSSEEMVNGLNKSTTPDEFLTEDVVGMAPQDDIEIELPNDVVEDDFFDYLEYLSTHYAQPLPIIKKWILEKREKFWESFRTWKRKQDSSNEEPIPIIKNGKSSGNRLKCGMENRIDHVGNLLLSSKTGYQKSGLRT